MRFVSGIQRPHRARSSFVAATVLALLGGLLPLTGAAAQGRFVDDDGNVHEAMIEQLAADGVTKGCNPPDNDRYCPDDPVTRGQMAAFMARAFGLVDGAGDDAFVDDGGVFEEDIDRLAEAGITKGCNPPENDRFCPNDLVTRGQMAAFIGRALGLTDGAGNDVFVDDDGSVFELDIDRLAEAGITKGCNPPLNDRFCPDAPVRRDEMASFMVRTVNLLEPPPPDPQPGQVAGHVFEDLDGDGALDAGEPGMAGVAISVRDGAGTDWDATTDVYGDFAATELSPGDIDVSFATPAGYALTTGNAAQTLSLPSGGSVETAPVGYRAEIEPPPPPPGQGNVRGHVFDDADGSGTQDPGEDGMAGVAVEIVDDDGVVHDATTDVYGDYTVVGAAAGDATVTVTTPANHTLTTGNAVQVLVVTVGETAEAAPVGFQADEPPPPPPVDEFGTVAGHVYDDTDGNGAQNGGEAGFEGVAIEIVDANATVHETTTDQNGDFEVAGVAAGEADVDYIRPIGYVLTTDNDPQTVVVVADAVVEADDVGYQINDVSFDAVTGEVGLVQTHSTGTICDPPIGSGSAWADYDNDGDLDLFVTDRGGPNHLYRNDGDTSGDGLPDYTDVAASLGVDDPSGAGHGAVFVDYDNDGDQDLYVTNWGGNNLYENDLVPGGTAMFADVTDIAGVEDGGRAITATWADFDNDGYLDLYLAKHKKCGSGNPDNVDKLFHANGDGTFDNWTKYLCDGVSATCDDVSGLGFVGGWLDYDNDGDQDLYLVNDNIGEQWQPNRLWRNDGSDGLGGWAFTELSAATGTDISLNGMGLGVGDFDNDGWFDLAFSNIMAAKLLHAKGDGTYEDLTVSSGVFDATDPTITWGTVFFDYDNDGLLDLYFVNGDIGDNPPAPNIFLRNNGDLTFTDISEDSGLDNAFKARNASIADFDEDGYVDVFVGNYGMPPVLYHNRGGANHWLTVTVEGIESNRDGIGTRLWLTTASGTQMREISSGPTHGGGDQKAAFFGLADRANGTLVVQWPNGVVQDLGVIAADQAIHLVEPPS